MPFTPATPTTAVTWPTDTASVANSWTEDSASITQLFDLLADIDGNLIADSSGTTINLLGGYTAEPASTAVSIVDDTATVPVTWIVHA